MRKSAPSKSISNLETTKKSESLKVHKNTLSNLGKPSVATSMAGEIMIIDSTPQRTQPMIITRDKMNARDKFNAEIQNNKSRFLMELNKKKTDFLQGNFIISDRNKTFEKYDIGKHIRPQTTKASYLNTPREKNCVDSKIQITMKHLTKKDEVLKNPHDITPHNTINNYMLRNGVPNYHRIIKNHTVRSAGYKTRSQKDESQSKIDFTDPLVISEIKKSKELMERSYFRGGITKYEGNQYEGKNVGVTKLNLDNIEKDFNKIGIKGPSEIRPTNHSNVFTSFETRNLPTQISSDMQKMKAEPKIFVNTQNTITNLFTENTDTNRNNDSIKNQISNLSKIIDRALSGRLQQKKEQEDWMLSKQNKIHVKSQFYVRDPAITEKLNLKSASRNKTDKRINTVRPYSSTVLKTNDSRSAFDDLSMPVDQRIHKRMHNTKITSLIRKSRRRAKDGYIKDHLRNDLIKVETETGKTKVHSPAQIQNRDQTKDRKLLYQPERIFSQFNKITKSKNNGLQQIDHNESRKIKVSFMKHLFHDEDFLKYALKYLEVLKSDTILMPKKRSEYKNTDYFDTSRSEIEILENIPLELENPEKAQLFRQAIEHLVSNSDLFDHIKQIDGRNPSKESASNILNIQNYKFPNTLQSEEQPSETVRLDGSHKRSKETKSQYFKMDMDLNAQAEQESLRERVRLSNVIKKAPNSLKHELLAQGSKNKTQTINLCNIFDFVNHENTSPAVMKNIMKRMKVKEADNPYQAIEKWSMNQINSLKSNTNSYEKKYHQLPTKNYEFKKSHNYQHSKQKNYIKSEKKCDLDLTKPINKSDLQEWKIEESTFKSQASFEDSGRM